MSVLLSNGTLRRLRVVLGLVLMLALPDVAKVAGNAYVADEHSANVAQYAIAAWGQLSPLTPPTVGAGTNPFGLALTPNGRSAYVVNIADNTVSQYDINPVTGTLTPKTPATVAAGGGPRGIAVSPDGKSAYVTNGFTDADTVSQYNIDPVTGVLIPKTPATVPAGSEPLGVAVTPDNKSAYVTNAGPSTVAGNTVSQYNIDPVTGALSPKSPATVATGAFPESVAMNPDGRSAYVTGASTFDVSQYNIDPVTGALSPKSPPTVPAGVGPAGIAVTPDGESAYVTNQNFGFGNNISQYNIDPVTGVLSPKTPATVATGVGPGFVAVTPDDMSAYVTNFQDSTISQYKIDPLTGVLSPKIPATVATGAQPDQIAVKPPGVPTTKDQCKNGGWRNFPQFKNQGDCLSFVEAGK